MYRKEKHDTAQLMVITAFIIAITFLLLATLLNLVIYAENQAARGLTVAEQSAYETQTQTGDTLHSLMYETNRGIIGDNYTKLHNSYRNGSTAFATVQKISIAREQHLVQTRVKKLNNGTRVIQDTDRNFSSAGNATDWTVVDDTGGVRNMTQTVNRSSLYTHSNSSENIDPSVLSVIPAFETQVVTSSGTWKVFILDKDYTNEILIYTVNPAGNKYDTCTRVTSRMTINYSAQTANGTHCPALEFLSKNVTPTYDITYRNADNVRGQYHIHTDKNFYSFSGNLHSPSSGDSPYKSASIYSLTYSHSFVSDRIDYETTKTVNPKELTEEK